MTANKPLFDYCLRLGDNALIQSYRLSEWCSNGPLLEEDLALTNIALDMIGRAQGFLKYAGEIEGKGRTDDDLAYKRGEKQFRNNLIAEMPNGDFATTVARQFYIAVFECYLFEQLSTSTDETIAALSAKTLKEVKYHLAHFYDWLLRLGNGTNESHERMQTALNEMWMYTGELFEMDAVDEALIPGGIATDLLELMPKWTLYVTQAVDTATLTMPGTTYMQTGSRKGNHSEHLGHILTEMQYLQRAYPDSKW